MPEVKKPVYVFIEASSGISKKTGNPYNILKAADPITYENHVIKFDPERTGPLNHFVRGDRIHIDLQAVTPYDNTQPLAYYVSKENKGA